LPAFSEHKRSSLLRKSSKAPSRVKQIKRYVHKTKGMLRVCDLQVTVVAFKRGQLKVLSVEWDRDLGGKDFDEVLFTHFVEEFDAKYKIDIRSNKRASFRLRLAVEKVPFPPSSPLPPPPGLSLGTAHSRLAMIINPPPPSHTQTPPPFRR